VYPSNCKEVYALLTMTFTSVTLFRRTVNDDEVCDDPSSILGVRLFNPS
jgi:hypothetical protein